MFDSRSGLEKFQKERKKRKKKAENHFPLVVVSALN